jgi:hypothetical protein
MQIEPPRTEGIKLKKQVFWLTLFLALGSGFLPYLVKSYGGNESQIYYTVLIIFGILFGWIGSIVDKLEKDVARIDQVLIAMHNEKQNDQS